MSYPPVDKVASHRTGFGSEPVFYAAYSELVAAVEIGAKAGDFVAMSVWEITQAAAVATMGFLPEVFEPWGHETPFAQKMFPTISDIVDALPKEQREAARARYSFIYRNFMRNSDVDTEAHGVSAALARCMGFSPSSTTIARDLKKGELIAGAPYEGIMYPSVLCKGKGVNLALRPNTANESLRFLWCTVGKLRGKPDMGLSRLEPFEETDFALARNDQSLEWKHRPGVWLWPPGTPVVQTGPMAWSITPRPGVPVYRG